MLKASGHAGKEARAGQEAREERPPAVAETGTVQELTSLMNPQGLAIPQPGVGYRSFKVPPYTHKPGDKMVPFQRKRRLTADHMVYSKAVSPHVVTVAEIDVHATMELRKQHRAAYERDGVSLNVLAFVCAAVVRALREFPQMNSRVLEDGFVMLGDINLGVAIETQDGLVAPNLKRADELSLRGMARAIGELAAKAREGKLQPDDLAGGTFTVSNPGAKGNLFGAAVISQPNVGILRMGEVKKRVVVVEAGGAGCDGDSSGNVRGVVV